MRLVTCHHCKRKDNKEIMLKKGSRYVHKECQEFIDKERQEWDELYQYILKLHDIVRIPKPNIVRLQELRNGNDIKNGQRYKKYKMGVPYWLMLDAYKLAEEQIRWCIKNKLNNVTDVQAINYCISVMLGKLNEAWKNRKMAEKRAQDAKVETQRLIKDTNSMMDVTKRIQEVQQNKLQKMKQSNDEVDITTLLD